MLYEIPDVQKLRSMNKKELEKLARDIRGFLLAKISEKGGHLASNLGTVELTIALFRAFDFPRDKIVFDVGHQSYTYKLLSGRKAGFDSLREFQGMSGFPKCAESEYDSFDTGHSSTGVSAGLGLCRARDLSGSDYRVISVLGDGAATGGETFEAFNNLSSLKSGFIIILNDNEMSIGHNVGAVSRYLTAVRSSESYNRMKKNVKKALYGSQVGESLIRGIDNTKDSLKEIVMPGGMLFENMGIKYLGPVDGHDVLLMEKIMKRAILMNRPVLIHVITKKGKGYSEAEKRPSLYHGVGAFDLKQGVQHDPERKAAFSDILCDFMLERGGTRKNIVAVTAAMGDSVGFRKFRKHYRNRYFDVGIAEEHAVTFAAGLAKGGFHPYVAIYSSFLQRAYDQILSDVCLQDLPVTFLLDRAGLVGRDGETHQGVFDLSYLSSMPGMTVLSPRSASEFIAMLEFSLDYQGPLAIRYPRGEAPDNGDAEALSFGKAETPVCFVPDHGNGDHCADPLKVLLLSCGTMFETAKESALLLKEAGIASTLVNMRFVKPFDEELIRREAPLHDLTVTLEDNVLSGGFGEHVAAFLLDEGIHAKIERVAVPDAFVPQGSVPELRKYLKTDAGSVTERILNKARK